jgi:putative phosphoesterase
MKIGILSDSHDNLPKIEKAVRFFNKNKVGFVLHAGDFIAPFAIPKLKALNCDWCGIFGNNDGEKNGLSGISENKIQEGPLRIELNNRKITLVHDINKIDLKTEAADLVIFGHTHKSEVLRQDSKLLINPGECGGWLTGKSTVAMVDLNRLSGKIFKII